MTLDDRMRVLVVRMRLHAERWPSCIGYLVQALQGGLEATEGDVTAMEDALAAPHP